MGDRGVKTQRTGNRARALGLPVLLLLLGVILLAITRLQQVRQHLTSAQMALGRLEAGLSGGQAGLIQLVRDPEQVEELRNNLATLDADLAAVEKLAWPILPLCPHLGWLPGVGGDLQAAPHLLSMARQTAGAGLALADGLAPLAGRLGQAEGGLNRLGPELVQGLVAARPQIEAAQAALARAAGSRAAVDEGRLSPRLEALIGRFDRVLPLLEEAPAILAALPGLLGADGPRTYLLLAQNNQELRATGGFISGVGLVQIADGQIGELHFQDSYAVDDLTRPHPPPPDPLRRQMGAGMLLLRDANWWPDFPTSAQRIADLYRQDQGRVVDGVVAVDLTTLRLFLQAIGPVQVPGYDRPVDSNNMQTMLISYWEAPRVGAPGREESDWWQHRKDFAADLLAAILSRLSAHADPEELAALAQAAGTALRQRHLLLYVTDPQGQAFLRQMGWDGALRDSPGDYLLVVDSNVGFNKVNPNIEQTIDYQAVVDPDGAATVQLTLTYRHRVQQPMPACVHESRYGDRYADLLERCYWDWLRIYLPQGSQPVRLSGADEPAEVYQESGRTVVATSFLLESGQARQIQLLYRPGLPVPSNRYVVFIQKQAGTEALPLRVRITPPAGAQPAAGSSPGLAWVDGRGVWQGDLAQDREIVLTWK